MTKRDLTPLTDNPFGLRRMGHLFDDMWRDFPRPMFGTLRDLGDMEMPRVDVTEDDTSIRISSELPGMDEKDVEVIMSGNRLTIKGEKKEETKKDEEKGHTYYERSYGKFERSFTVGDNVNADDIEAKFDKGVLSIVLPKAETPKETVRKITIET